VNCATAARRWPPGIGRSSAIKRVIAIDHRDCGAARIAYGEAKIANPEIETETHKAALAEFRKQVAERHPQLGVETGLMALDGTMQMFT
jgi:hypothetical protein